MAYGRDLPEGGNEMKGLGKGIACLLAAGLLAGAPGCSKEKPVPPEEHPPIRGATVEKIETTTIPARFEATGTVRAKNSATLSARISGTVSRILVKEGDRVRRGTLLATLDAMESTAGAAGAAYAAEEALARKKLADVTYERFSRLFDEQAVTRQELDTRRAERDMADQALARAREAARAAGAIAGYTKIVAPLSGIVSAKSVDVGATVFPGMPLLTVEEEGQFRLEVNTPESLLGKIRMGQEIPVSLDGVNGKRTGRVAEIVPKVDPVSRTFTVKLDIPSKGVRSGQFGRAFFLVGEKKGITIPASAIMERGQLTSVWAVDSRNIARMRLVKPGDTYGDHVEILAGLSDGDRVVVGGMEKVTDGARIE
jgi:multidrug efflux system membrane fusion protein